MLTSSVDIHLALAISTRSTPVPTTVKFGIDSSPPGSVQPSLPTGTQGEEGKAHGIGVSPVSRSSGLQWTAKIASAIERIHSTTMVRVPGSFGDLAFHRDSLGEDVKIKTEPGIGASEKEK